MADRDEFRVRVKPSAAEANASVEALLAERGDTLRYDSRPSAETEAARLSEQGTGRVAIQHAAPQEPDPVDAYLVASPERRTHEPVETADGRLAFETTAAQFGALGETLVCCYAANPPLLTEHVRRDLGVDGNRIWIALDRDPDPVVYRATDGGSRLAWVPDCVARARDGHDGPVLREYYCEIKTGDASFQRDQAAVMAYQAREAPVLKVRVDVGDLPDRYTARIDEVEPEEPPADLTALSSPDARLDDFA